MLPTVISLGPIPIYSFGLMLMLAFLAAWKRFEINLKAEGQETRHAENMLIWCAVGGLLGARLIFVVTFYEQFLEDPINFLISGAGFVFYGGFIGGIVASLIYCRKEGIYFFQFADYAAAPLAIGYAIGRIGCHLSGDGDYGQVTDLFLGFRYELGVVPSPQGDAMHPSPIYESLNAFLLCYLLLKARSWGYLRDTGQLFSFYLGYSAVSRFFVEFIRLNPKMYWGFSQAQLISGPLLMISILIFMLGSWGLFHQKSAAPKQA